MTFDIKFQKDEASKRDAILCDKLNDLEHNLMREKDEYRTMVAANNELNVMYDETLRDKENKIRMVKDLREQEINLEQQIRKLNDNFTEKDSQDVIDSVNNLQRNRRECIDDLRDMAKRIDDTMNVIANITDAQVVHDQTSGYKARLGELEYETQAKDARVLDCAKENFNVNLEVDQNRRVRGDFEAENKNLLDLKCTYDNVLIDHSRLKSEYQTFDRQNRDAKADLQSIVDRKQLIGNKGKDEVYKNTFSHDRTRFTGHNVLGSTDKFELLGLSSRKEGMSHSGRKE